MLSPGLSPAMPHTGSEKETEALRLVCDQMRQKMLSRPLPRQPRELIALVFATLH